MFDKGEIMKSVLIKDTTKAERIALIKEWIPHEDGLGDCEIDLWDMYRDYINGEKENHHFVSFRVVTDERICDGFYYASAFKQMMRYVNHPENLDLIPETVVEDID